MDAYPSSPSHRRGGSCDAPSAVRVQLVPGSPEVRGHTSSGTTAVVWGTPGMDPGWTPPTLGPLRWTLDGPLPISLLPPDLVKCQLLISWSGWAGSKVVAWALLEIELIQNVNHHLSAFISRRWEFKTRVRPLWRVKGGEFQTPGRLSTWLHLTCLLGETS